jgi:hypothetical protein
LENQMQREHKDGTEDTQHTTFTMREIIR